MTVAHYYTRDHLGSVREMLNGSGSIVARYGYDPYGRTTLVQGTNLATKQYANYYQHQTSGLALTRYRAYDVNTGRWLSRDPLGEGSDATLYSYVANNPTNLVDPSGLYFVLPSDPADAATVANALEELSQADLNYYHSQGTLPGPSSLNAMLLQEASSPYPITISITHVTGDQESPGNCPGSSNVGWNPNWDPNDPTLELSLLAHELQHAYDESIYPKNQINPNNYNPNDAPPWEQRAVRRQNQAIQDLNLMNGTSDPILQNYPSGRNPPVPNPTGNPLAR